MLYENCEVVAAQDKNSTPFYETEVMLFCLSVFLKNKAVNNFLHF